MTEQNIPYPDNMETTSVTLQDTFFDVKAGDTVTRMLAGVIPLEYLVTKVDDELIYVCTLDGNVDGWTFDRATGVEEDHELGWGVKFGISGSYLVKPNKEN